MRMMVKTKMKRSLLLNYSYVELRMIVTSMRRSHRCELLHGISKSPMPPPRSPPRKSIEPPPIAAGSKPSGIGAGGSSAFRASSSSGDAAANAAKAATIGAEPPPALCCENGMRERVRKDKWQNRTRTDSLDSRKAITCKIERRLSRAANGLNDDLLVTIHLREFSQRHSVKRDGSQARDHLFLRSAQVSHVGVGTVAVGNSEYLQQSANSHLIYFPVILNNTSSVLFFFNGGIFFNLQYD